MNHILNPEQLIEFVDLRLLFTTDVVAKAALCCSRYSFVVGGCAE